MSKAHTIPLHIGDLIEKTYDLTPAEFGAYMRLILKHYGMREGLPADDDRLRRMTGMDNKSWSRSKDLILGFFDLDIAAQKYRHAKVQEVLSKMTAIREQNSDKSLKRWNRPDATALPQESNSTPTGIQSINHKPEANRSAASSSFQQVYDHGISIFPDLAPKSTAAIRLWLDSGCDVDRDIIPELDRMKGRDIGGWNYFTKGITQAKATREAGLPTVAAKGQQPAFEVRAEPTTEQRVAALRWKKDKGIFISSEDEALLASQPEPEAATP